MTKDQVQTRLDLLITEREQVKATLAAYEGAIQANQYWIAEFNKETKEEK